MCIADTCGFWFRPGHWGCFGGEVWGCRIVWTGAVEPKTIFIVNNNLKKKDEIPKQKFISTPRKKNCSNKIVSI